MGYALVVILVLIVVLALIFAFPPLGFAALFASIVVGVVLVVGARSKAGGGGDKPPE